MLNVYKKDSGSINVNGVSIDGDEIDAKNQIGIVVDESLNHRSWN